MVLDHSLTPSDHFNQWISRRYTIEGPKTPRWSSLNTLNLLLQFSMPNRLLERSTYFRTAKAPSLWRSSWQTDGQGSLRRVPLMDRMPLGFIAGHPSFLVSHPNHRDTSLLRSKLVSCCLLLCPVDCSVFHAPISVNRLPTLDCGGSRPPTGCHSILSRDTLLSSIRFQTIASPPCSQRASLINKTKDNETKGQIQELLLYRNFLNTYNPYLD